MLPTSGQSPLQRPVPLQRPTSLQRPVPLGGPSPLQRLAPARPTSARRPTAIYRGLPTPIRIVAWVLAAVVVGFVLGATAPTALRRLGAVAALQPEMLAWYSVRTLGFLAYLVVAGSVLYGLLLSTKLLDAIAHRPVSFALHKDLAIAGLVLSTLHVGILLADKSFAFTLRSLLVPFQSPYQPIWVGVGQLTFYAVAVVTASFYFRRLIGQRAWRLLHYVTFLAFAGATVHGITTGTDSGQAWAFWVYLVPLASAVFLLTYRIAVSLATRLSGTEAVATAPVTHGQLGPAPRLIPAEFDSPAVQPRRLAGLFD